MQYTTILALTALLNTAIAYPPPYTSQTYSSFNTSIIVPLYFEPSNGGWNRLFTALDDHPGQPFVVVINPNTGPGGSTYPSDDWKRAIARLNTNYTESTQIGYVYANNGDRDENDVKKDIDKYRHWGNYTSSNITVQGIFIDTAPTDIGDNNKHLNYMADLYNYIRAEFGNDTLVVTNPGDVCNVQFYTYADVIISYENSLSNVNNSDKVFESTDTSKSYGSHAQQNGAIVYSFPNDDAKVAQYVNDSVNLEMAMLYLQSSNDYKEFPEFFDVFVDDVAEVNSRTRVAGNGTTEVNSTNTTNSTSGKNDAPGSAHVSVGMIFSALVLSSMMLFL